MKTNLISSVLLTLTLVACNQNAPVAKSDTPAATSAQATAAAAEMTPEQLGELGARISVDAANAKQLLSEHGLDEKSFEVKIRKVTEDPEASKRYAAAFEKASKT